MYQYVFSYNRSCILYAHMWFGRSRIPATEDYLGWCLCWIGVDSTTRYGKWRPAGLGLKLHIFSLLSWKSANSTTTARNQLFAAYIRIQVNPPFSSMIFPALNLYLLRGFQWISDISFWIFQPRPSHFHLAHPWALGPQATFVPMHPPGTCQTHCGWAEPGRLAGGRNDTGVQGMFLPIVIYISWSVVSKMVFIFHIIYGISSFPLTNSYFSKWLLHHQPVSYVRIILGYPRIPWLVRTPASLTKIHSIHPLC